MKRAFCTFRASSAILLKELYGKISNSLNHYLSDNRRFADLFNEICFHGETVVRAEDLPDGTQVYYGAVQESERNGQSK